MDALQIPAIIAALVAAFLVGRLAYRLIFADSDDFLECLRFSFTPDLVSLFRGGYFEAVVKSFKFGMFMILTTGAGALVNYGVVRIG